MTRRDQLIKNAQAYAMRAQRSEMQDNFHGRATHRTTVLKMAAAIFWRVAHNVSSPND